MPEKPHLNLVTIGHVDHGKSTLVGRLLVEHGDVPESEIKKFEAMGEKGKSFKYAWVMDRLKEERERGLTIDLMHRKFESNKNYFTVIDAPGHRDFVKNMITGASQADAALLVVAADEGVNVQTREHAALAFTLGIQQIIVAINKMDRVDFKQSVYEAVKADVIKLLKSIGYGARADQFPFIPISAFYGHNLSKRSDQMKWYTGKIILEALDDLEPPKKAIDKPLRIPVQDVYTITGVGTVPVGRVESGILKAGDTVIFQPSGVKGEVKSIEMHHVGIPKAEPGDNIGFNVRGVGRNDIRRGDVAGHLDSPPTVAKEFIGKVVILEYPTAITVGYTPVFHCHTAQVAVTFTELIQTMDPKTGAVKEKNPATLKKGDVAICRFTPTRPLVIETAADIPQLSRFAIRDQGQTIGAGICTEITQKA